MNPQSLSVNNWRIWSQCVNNWIEANEYNPNLQIPSHPDRQSETLTGLQKALVNRYQSLLDDHDTN